MMYLRGGKKGKTLKKNCRKRSGFFFKTCADVMLVLSLFLPCRFPLLLVDLVVGVTQFDLRVICQARRDDVQFQVFVILNDISIYSQKHA